MEKKQNARIIADGNSYRHIVYGAGCFVVPAKCRNREPAHHTVYVIPPQKCIFCNLQLCVSGRISLWVRHMVVQLPVHMEPFSLYRAASARQYLPAFLEHCFRFFRAVLRRTMFPPIPAFRRVCGSIFLLGFRAFVRCVPLYRQCSPLPAAVPPPVCPHGIFLQIRKKLQITINLPFFIFLFRKTILFPSPFQIPICISGKGIYLPNVRLTSSA